MYFLSHYLSQIARRHSEAVVSDVQVLHRKVLRPVYNLGVEENENYFANAVLTHNCGTIDDALKDDEAAKSELIKHRQTEWYGSTFSTREDPNPLTGEPDGAIIVGGTRWDAGDLYGWLLSQETESDAPEHWHIVCFDAIRSENPPEFPATCTVEPDWRKPGEALCPERQPLEKLLRIKGRISEYWWNALYQQQPRPLEGTLFKVGKIEIVDAIPVGCRKIRYWDKSATEGGSGAESAGVLGAAAPDNRFYIEDVVHGRWSVGEREATIKQTAEIDGYSVAVWTEQEPGSGGKESAEATIRNLSGFLVHADRVTGDKVARAGPLAAQVEAGNVYMKRASWNKYFIDQLREFPNGRLKDMVDAASGSFNKLAHTKVEWGFYMGGGSTNPLKIVG